MNEKKYYSIDLGFSNLMHVPNLEFRGTDLETIVFFRTYTQRILSKQAII